MADRRDDVARIGTERLGFEAADGGTASPAFRDESILNTYGIATFVADTRVY